MKLALTGFLIINFIFIVLFVLGKEIIFKIKNNPNLTAGYALVLGFLFVFYFLAIFAVVLASIAAHKFLPVSLLLFVVFPFAIGRKVTYDRLIFYSNLQVLALFGSLILALSFLKVL